MVIDHIGELVTNDPSLGAGPLGLIRDAAVVIVGEHIEWVGPRGSLGSNDADHCLDAGGSAVLPGFVEPHSHLIFAGDRAEEFRARMAGESYHAGGIRSTIAATRAASDEQLGANRDRLLAEYLRQGVTSVEIKSGYGQSVPDEARSVALAADRTPEATLLAAHVVPPEFAGRSDDYVQLILDEMIPTCAPDARWIDAFCERGAFDVDQCRAVLTAGQRAGLGVRVHANQLTAGGGIQLGVELGAASVDHVCHVSDADIEALASSDTVATVLPAADFSTRNPYPPARRLLDAGVALALGADCNPGTSYTTSIPFCIALAVRDLHLTPAEAAWAATAGAAQSLRRNDIGQLTPGARADLVLLDAPSHVHLAYRPGVPLVRQVIKNGVLHG